MKAIAKWTIGETTPNGYECLIISIASFIKFYDLEVVICHNCPTKRLPCEIRNFILIDQKEHLGIGPEPKGVAWKLYPPRIDINRHEISIDNDLVINEKITYIDEFLCTNSTLLLEDDSRTYGRFENHVPPGFKINSGIYGIPPHFDLESYIKFYAGKEWEKNALNQYDKSETFDEQGIVALALLNHYRYIIIPSDTITKCEHNLVHGQGHHFIGLNRRKYHSPFRLYQSMSRKLFL